MKELNVSEKKVKQYERSLKKKPKAQISEEKKKITVFQITEALKKKGYTPFDFVNFILQETFEYEDIVEEPSDKQNDQIEKLINSISDILNGESAVDYRDTRTYADVLSGKPKIGETGTGPEIMTISKIMTTNEVSMEKLKKE